MKKTAPFLFSVVILLALTLTSCYWRPDFNSGGLQVDLSGITPRVGNDGEVIRIYLFADGLLFSAGGGSPFVAEIPASSSYQEQKVNISGLPVGPKYRAMVGVGPVNSGLFAPYYYGDSGQFLINPNADTSVTVTMQGVPRLASISPDLLGKNLRGLTDSDFSVYAAEEKIIHTTYYDSFSSSWLLQDSYDLVADPAGAGIAVLNSLSKGGLSENAYINSPSGILPFYGQDGWRFSPTFSAAMVGNLDIKQSGSFQYGVGDWAVFFRRENGLGGAYVLNKDISLPANWKWVNVDFSGVRDLVVSKYNAYYAAGGAVFALPPAFLSDVLSGNPPNLEAHRIDLPSPAPVLSLGFRPDPLGLPGGTLALGTSDGVYQAALDESVSAQLAPGPTRIAETAGDIIERIAISSYNSRAEAYLSRYYLYIRNWDGSSYYVQKTPFFAAVPGRATGLAWDANGTLYISGTEGLSAVYVGYSAC